MVTLAEVQQFLLAPLVNQWFARIEAAKSSRKRWDTVAKLCRQFFGCSPKAQWEDSFRQEFYPNLTAPRFMVSVNKTFEYIAQIGPALVWEYPSREVRSAEPPDQMAIAGVMLGGQMNEQVSSQLQQQLQQEQEVRRIRNDICSKVLDYIVREHPGGVLSDIQAVVQDALTTGRGCAWTETYTDRVTGAPLVGTFYGSPDDLYLDPDAKDMTLRDVRWMARKHIEPTWLVERRFGYPPGYLQGKGTHVSQEWGSVAPQTGEAHRQYSDMIEWFEIWSCGGIGVRVQGVSADLGQAIDNLLGEYCYLCVTRNLPHPLNLPPGLVNQGTPQQIVDMTRWRSPRFGQIFELWKDRRWPVEILDFYPVANTVWPAAPLAPGLGCLLAMNILLASMLEMSWDRRRDIIAAYEHMAQQVMEAVSGENNPAVIKLNAAGNQSVSDVVAFLQRPPIQGDLLQWISYLDEQFKRATGLDDMAYGLMGRQARVNADVEMRRSKSEIRPEKMQKDVVNFLRGIGTKELWLAVAYLPSERLRPLLGPWGVIAWESLVRSMSFDTLIQETDVQVEVTQMQRPDREKDMSDLERIFPYAAPVMQRYAELTGDSTPMNALIGRFAEAMQLRNPEMLQMSQWAQSQPDPQMQQMQTQQMQAEIARVTADAEDKRAKAMARLIDAQYKSQGASAPAMQRMQFAELNHEQQMRHRDEDHLQKILLTQRQIEQEQSRAAVRNNTR